MNLGSLLDMLLQSKKDTFGQGHFTVVHWTTNQLALVDMLIIA